MSVPPPPHEGLTIGPELALVDPGTARHAPSTGIRRAPEPSPLQVVRGDVREAMLRICELSDVNPPRRLRRARVLVFSGVATLWLEVLMLAAAQAHIGLS